MSHDVRCYCGAEMRMTGGRDRRRWFNCVRPQCDGKIGAHVDGRPMGTPGDLACRHARIQAHQVFDDWWQGKGWKRANAYRWLARKGPKPHIGDMTERDCRALVFMLTPKAPEPT